MTRLLSRKVAFAMRTRSLAVTEPGMFQAGAFNVEDHLPATRGLAFPHAKKVEFRDVSSAVPGGRKIQLCSEIPEPTQVIALGHRAAQASPFTCPSPFPGPSGCVQLGGGWATLGRIGGQVVL